MLCPYRIAWEQSSWAHSWGFLYLTQSPVDLLPIPWVQACDTNEWNRLVQNSKEWLGTVNQRAIHFKIPCVPKTYTGSWEEWLIKDLHRTKQSSWHCENVALWNETAAQKTHICILDPFKYVRTHWQMKQFQIYFPFLKRHIERKRLGNIHIVAIDGSWRPSIFRFSGFPYSFKDTLSGSKIQSWQNVLSLLLRARICLVG